MRLIPPTLVSIVSFPLLASFSLVALAGPIGCGGQSSAAASLPSFQDLSTAPAAIKKAAEAVVRIETATEAATGSFISANGLLLTNNHVLGTPICPVEGCYAKISFDYQRGDSVPTPQSVFVIPKAASVGLDMAVVQVYSPQGGATFAPPSFLNVESRTVASLMKTHVTIVGHPEGHLKKWTAGEVVDSNGDWIWTSAYILPGNSGSPILDDAGNLVGIIHRSPTGEDLISTTGLVSSSIGTVSASLLAAMQAPLPPEMISIAAPTTAAAVVGSDIVYLNAHTSSAPLASTDADGGAPPTGETIDILSALGSACDTGLAGTYATPEDMEAALVPCDDALSWIECRAEELASSPGKVCPDATAAAAWAQRFVQMNAVWVALNGETYVTPLSFGTAALAPTSAAGKSSGGGALLQALNAAAQPLDLGVANYLAAFAIASYAGVQIPSYVTGYQSIPDYQLNAGNAASAAVWLANAGLLTGTQGLGVVQQLYADPSVDVGDKLYIEDIEYQSGVLK